MFGSEYFSDVKINNGPNDKLIDFIWDILAWTLVKEFLLQVSSFQGLAVKMWEFRLYIFYYEMKVKFNSRACYRFLMLA